MPNSLWDTANTLLTNVVDILDDAGLNPPTRRYVQVGEVVLECALIVVQIGDLHTGAPFNPNDPVRPGRPTQVSADYTIWIIRDCAPDEPTPTAAALNTFANTIADDMYTTFMGLLTRHVAGTLLPTCQNMVLGPCTPAGPEGLVGGFTCVVSTEL